MSTTYRWILTQRKRESNSALNVVFPEQVNEREVYKLKTGELNLRGLEIKKDLEVQKMNNSTERMRMRLEANKTLLNQRTKMYEMVERGVDKEDEMYQNGASNLGKGFGGAVGMVCGGPAMGTFGAVAGEFMGKGVASISTAANRQNRIQERVEVATKQLAVDTEGLVGLEKDLARDPVEYTSGDGRELQIGDMERLMIENN